MSFASPARLALCSAGSCCPQCGSEHDHESTVQRGPHPRHVTTLNIEASSTTTDHAAVLQRLAGPRRHTRLDVQHSPLTRECASRSCSLNRCGADCVADTCFIHLTHCTTIHIQPRIQQGRLHKRQRRSAAQSHTSTVPTASLRRKEALHLYSQRHAASATTTSAAVLSLQSLARCRCQAAAAATLPGQITDLWSATGDVNGGRMMPSSSSRGFVCAPRTPHTNDACATRTAAHRANCRCCSCRRLAEGQVAVVAPRARINAAVPQQPVEFIVRDEARLLHPHDGVAARQAERRLEAMPLPSSTCTTRTRLGVPRSTATYNASPSSTSPRDAWSARHRHDHRRLHPGPSRTTQQRLHSRQPAR